jgi:hypothetical protein
VSRQVVLICEDSQHEAFARRVLYKRGYVSRDFTDVRKRTRAKGSAEQFVREEFLSELRRYHNRHHRYEIVVVCDADRTDRVKQWRQAAEKLGIQWPDGHDAVGLFFPNREIENWIYHLRGHDVSEDDRLRKLDRAGDCQDAVDRLAEICDSGDIPDGMLPSLRDACDEYQRFRSA